MTGSEDKKAYLTYHDYDRHLTYRWDGESAEIELHSGGLVNHKLERIPVQGSPFDRSFTGVLRWFESICAGHTRMREAAGEEVAGAQTPASETPEQ